MTTIVGDNGVGTIRVGLIGGGFMGRVHSRAARACGAELVTVASSSPESAARIADELGITRSAADAATLISASDVDLVDVCTPNATHAVLAGAAIEAGKHVICEKPLATSIAEARALASAAAVRGVVAAVPFVYRYHPMVREARARVAAGELGSLFTLDCAYLQDWMLDDQDHNWRADTDTGGSSRAFADIGSHLCDLVEFVAGERMTLLSARTRRVYRERGGHPVANEDAVTLMTEFESGAIGSLLISQVAAGRKNSLTLELHGAKASVRFDQERPEELWIGRREGNQLLLRDPKTSFPDAARLSMVPTGHPMGYQDAFNAFTADVFGAVNGAVPEGLPSFADGVRAAQLTDAVLLSAETQHWVSVAE